MRIHLQHQFRNLVRIEIELQSKVWLGIARSCDLCSDRESYREHDHPRSIVLVDLVSPMTDFAPCAMMHNEGNRRACTHSLLTREKRLAWTPGILNSKLPSCGA